MFPVKQKPSNTESADWKTSHALNMLTQLNSSHFPETLSGHQYTGYCIFVIIIILVVVEVVVMVVTVVVAEVLIVVIVVLIVEIVAAAVVVRVVEVKVLIVTFFLRGHK